MSKSIKPSPNCTELIWVTPAIAKEYNAAADPESARAVIKAATIKLGDERLSALRADAECRLKAILDLITIVRTYNESLPHALEGVKAYQIEYLADQLDRIVKFATQLTPEVITALQVIISTPNKRPLQ